MMYAKEINGIVQEVILPNAYNGVLNVAYGYALRTDLHIQDGFLEYIKPALGVNQKYGETNRVNDTYVVEVLDLTADEIAAIEEAEGNKLRIDSADREAIIANIKHYLVEDLSKAVKTVLDENLERVYCLKETTTPLIKIVYTKEIDGITYVRRSNMYAYKVNGSLDDEIIDTRIAQFTEREIISYKTSLVNNVMNIFKTKAKEVDDLVGNNDTTNAVDYLFSESTIKLGLDYAKQFGDVSKLVAAIQAHTAVTMPILFANVPDWHPEDALKFGVPVGYTPKIKDWVLLYFNETNFNIYG